MTSAIPGTSGWNGPAFVLGPRVYLPERNTGQVLCFDYSADATCANFPIRPSNLGGLYTVNPDPQRPTCIWINSDDGTEQIQNFDAYSGGGCGQGPIRVLASSLVVPNPICVPTSYTSLQVLSPPPGTYTNGTVSFQDSDGNVITGTATETLDATGAVALSSLNLNTGVGLPQFLITLNAPSATPSSVAVKLTWTGTSNPECVPNVTSHGPTLAELRGGHVLGAKTTTCSTRLPVNCATGDFYHSFDDLGVPGRGVPLDFTRNYSAVMATSNGPLGFGWTDNYNMSLSLDSTGNATVTQENGSQVTFAPDGSGGFTAPSAVLATLALNADGTYTFKRFSDSIAFNLSSSGQLLSEVDRNGYATTLSYTGGNLTSVTDPAGRQLTFTYTGNNISKVTDPIGRSVSFAYDSAGDLSGAADVAGSSSSFTYDSSHRMLTMTDPRSGVLTNVYDGSGRVISQTDPLGRTMTWAYSGDNTSATGGTTTVTDPLGNQTTEFYEDLDLLSVTRAAGTSLAATTTYTYDPITLGIASATDPNGHVVSYTYDTKGNVLTQTDALGRTTTSTYNGFSEPLTVTDPLGLTTTYSYDSNGNVLSSSRPLSGTAFTRTTTYTYGDTTHPGDVTSLTDPDGKVWQLTYDTNGDLASGTDPVGDKTTYAYDAIGRRTSSVSPRGNALGATPPQFTTSYTYNAFGDLLTTTDPLAHVTSYTYDADRNRTSATDPNGRVTSYLFDADNELIKVNRADGTSLSYSYDADGNQTAQIDGASGTTSYTYNALNQESSTTDPLLRTTSYTYDGAGNRLTLTDPSGRVTTDTYDAANELIGVNYSDGTTPNVTYAYDTDGQRTSMTDGTGTTSYVYDSLHRLTSSTNGAGAVIGYSYDLVGNLTGLTYPNSQTVTRTYDAAGHLTGVTDWLGNTTNFGYDPDANLTGENYANGVSASTSFNDADQLTSISDTKSGTTLASFTYARDNSGQLTSDTSTGVSASPETYSYTALDQLASLNTASYGYDHADNFTQLANGTTQTYDSANELLSSTPASTSSSAPTLDQVVSTDQHNPVFCDNAKTLKGRRVRSRDCVGRREHTLLGIPFDAHVKTHPIKFQANELIVAFVTSDGPSPKVQVSGGGLTWTRVAQAIQGSLGDSEIWEAYTTSALHTSITASLGSLGLVRSLTVASFLGAANSVGAVSTGNGNSGTPSVSLTTTHPNSLVWGVGHNWAPRRMNKLVPNNGQKLVYSDRDSFDSSWVQRTDVVSAQGTTVNLGDSAPSNAAWTLAAVEILSASSMAGGPPTAYAYDKQGNRIGSTPMGGTTTNLTYDQANRLIGFGSNASYKYDGDGLRQSKTVSGVTTVFVWDQSPGTPLLLGDGSDYYVYGPGDNPIEKITGTTVLFLHQDQQGSTRVLTDSTGAVVGTYSYDPYGNVTSRTGTAVTTLQYDGQYTDTESGFQYLRARYYDPSTGQFIGVDPAYDLTNDRYSFANSNPTSFDDPTGLLSGVCATAGYDLSQGRSTSTCILFTGTSFTSVTSTSFEQGIAAHIGGGGYYFYSTASSVSQFNSATVCRNYSGGFLLSGGFSRCSSPQGTFYVFQVAVEKFGIPIEIFNSAPNRKDLPGGGSGDSGSGPACSYPDSYFGGVQIHPLH